jgi:hypothetical protein
MSHPRDHKDKKYEKQNCGAQIGNYFAPVIAPKTHFANISY